MASYTILVTFIILFAIPSQCDKQYRTDYIYNRKTDAFYKFHTETVMFQTALFLCKMEGGNLMVPSSHRDIAQAHKMLKKFPDLGELVWIGTREYQNDSPEVHMEFFSYSFVTEAMRELCEHMNLNGDIHKGSCHMSLPFICKVDAKDAPYDPHCGVFANDYEYFENVGSCYKKPQGAYSWNQAYDECREEGAHLVVLNSELEHHVVQNVIRNASNLYAQNDPWLLFAGIRAEKTFDGYPKMFKTIFNQTLKEAGYDGWSENEPNNAQGREYCGSISKKDGKYNDVNCSRFHGFVCEKEVKNKH